MLSLEAFAAVKIKHRCGLKSELATLPVSDGLFLHCSASARPHGQVSAWQGASCAPPGAGDTRKGHSRQIVQIMFLQVLHDR